MILISILNRNVKLFKRKRLQRVAFHVSFNENHQKVASSISAGGAGGMSSSTFWGICATSAKSARNPRLGEAGRNGGKDGEMRGIR